MLPPALGLHGAHFVLHAQDHAEDVGLEGLVEGLRSLVGDRAGQAFRGGVVHGDVKTTKPRDGLVDHSAQVILLTDIGVDELCVRTEGAQLLNERLASLVTSTGNDHVRALLAKATAVARPMPVSPPVIKTT